MTDRMAVARRTLKQALEDGKYWLTATPTRVNNLDASNVERFYETGNELVETIVGAIECGQHVALAGPRGCGKSYCIGEAIKRAQRTGLLPPNGSIKIQGNKELPRDYLIEDDIALKVNQKQVVTPERKDAPLFRFAQRDANGRPVIGADGDVVCFGRGTDGTLVKDPMRDDQVLALFLDEVNRFSDGVLDSLLLLLEEGEVIMGGDRFRLKVVVLMTMNPPGYDASARNLSPPLSARIGRQYRLLSPQINVLTDVIAPPVIAKLISRSKAIPLREPSNRLLRRAAAATLCCWGDPRSGKPGFEYLSSDMQDLLINLARSDPTLEAAMRTLNELCHFGPDARALIDWMKASAVAASNEAKSLKLEVAEIRGRHLIETSITVLSHKVQDNFSSSSRPDNTRRKEEAIHAIARALVDGGPEIDRLLHRTLDDAELLDRAAAALWKKSKGESDKLRNAMIDHGVANDDAVVSWCKFMVGSAAIENPDVANVKDTLIELQLGEPVGANGFAFSSEAYRNFTIWLSSQSWDGRSGPKSTTRASALIRCLGELSQERAYPNTIGRYIERLRCVQDRVWANDDELMAHIATAGVRATERAILREIADVIEYFWIRAEHYGPVVAEQIKERVDSIQLTPATRQKVQRMLVDAAKRMSGHKSRGSSSRRAWRRLQEQWVS